MAENDDRDGFKRGFIEHCKKAGMSLDDMHAIVDFALLEKQAVLPHILGGSGTSLLRRAWPWAAARLAPTVARIKPYATYVRGGIPWLAGGVAIGTGRAALGAARDIAAQSPQIYMQALPYIVGTLGAGGLALGAGAGHRLAETADDAETPDQIKARELAQTYKTYADRIRAKKQYQLDKQVQ